MDSATSSCQGPDPSPSPKPASKLDNLPRDELVKFLKKQQAALQKSKEKCQSLTLRVEELERDEGIPSSEDEARKLSEKQVEVLHQECDELRKALESTQMSTNSKINSLHEEIECLTHARDTAMAALKEFEEDGSGTTRQLRRQLDEMKKEQDALLDNIQKFKSSAEKLKLERDEANRKCDSLDSKCRDLESQVCTIEAESNDTEALVSNLRTKLLEAEAEIASLSEDNDQMQRDHQARLKAVKTEMLEKDDEIAVVQKELERRTDELADARSAVQAGMDESEAEWRGHLDEFQTVKALLGEQEQLNTELMDTINVRDLEIDKLKRELSFQDSLDHDNSTVKPKPKLLGEIRDSNSVNCSDVSTITDSILSDNSEVLVKLQSELNVVTSENVGLVEEKSALNEKLKVVSQSRDDLQNINTNLVEKVQEQSDKIVVLTSELLAKQTDSVDENLSQTIDHTDRNSHEIELTKLRETIALKDDEIEELQNECSLKRTEISRLQDEFIQWSKEREKLLESGKHCSDCALLSSQLQSMTEELGQAETSLASADNRMDSFSEMIRGLKEENLELKDKARGLVEQNTSLKEEASEIREGFNKLEEDNRDLKQQLMCLETDNDDLKSKLSEARSTYSTKITELEGEVARLTTSCSTTEEAMVELSETVRVIELKNEELRDQLLTLEAERNVVQNDLNSHTASDNELINETLEEIDDLKTQLADAKSENVTEIQEKVDNLENKNTLLADDLEESKESMEHVSAHAKETEKQLSDVQAALESSVNSEKELREKLDNAMYQADVWGVEKASMEEKLCSCELILAQEKERTARLTDQLENMSTEMSKLNSDIECLRAEKLTLEATQISPQANENQEQHNLLSLEMADYERSVANLQLQLKEKEAEITRLSQIITSNEEAKVVTEKDSDSQKIKTQKLEETVTKLKTLVMKTRKECSDAKEEISVKQAIINELEGKIMTANDEVEKLKLDLSKAVAECRAASESLTESLDSKNSVLHSTESQVLTLKSELRTVRQQFSAVQEEYHAYKIKVKNVLKQQKESSIDDSWQLEKEHLMTTIQLVQDKLQETSNHLTSLRKQYASLQDEYEQSVNHNREQMLHIEAREKELRAELERASTDRDQQSAGQASLIKQLTAQNEAIRVDFQARIKNMQAEHSSSINALEERLTFAEAELSLARRRTSPESSAVVAATSSEEKVPVHPLTIRIPPSDESGNLLSSFPGAGGIPPLSERAPGVGSESIDTPKAYSPVTSPSSHRHVMPLEELLKETAQDLLDRTDVDSLASPVRADAMLAQLDSAARRIQHLTEVLNESEANNARLTEQVKLLKEEIRRLERNEERKEHTANAEYLKNVIMKFLSLKGGDERTRLLPVLQTMLRPNAEEMRILSLLAKGEDALDSENAGWTGYLHRWTGISS